MKKKTKRNLTIVAGLALVVGGTVIWAKNRLKKSEGKVDELTKSVIFPYRGKNKIAELKSGIGIYKESNKDNINKWTCVDGGRGSKSCECSIKEFELPKNDVEDFSFDISGKYGTFRRIKTGCEGYSRKVTVCGMNVYDDNDNLDADKFVKAING